MTAKRRGRPPATDSEETRQAILDAARLEFATKGYDGTSLTAIAAETDLSPSALYYYFEGKEELYEAVMLATVDLVWSGLLTAVQSRTRIVDQVDVYLGGADRYGSDERMLSAFLVAVPVEASRNPMFAPLADALGEWQSQVFDHMAATGFDGGELQRFDTIDDASQALRLLLLGWSFETHYQPSLRRSRADAARRAVAAWVVD